MALSVRMTLRASGEITRADHWWKEHRTAARLAFEDDLTAALDLLRRQPAIGAKVQSSHGEGVRRVHLGRVRYFLYYRIAGNEVVILSLRHSSRRTGTIA